jgi:flagellar hook assembly protein FlgD
VNEDKSPGECGVVWDGKDQNGEPVSSGIYFYKLVSGDFSETARMVLIK